MGIQSQFQEIEASIRRVNEQVKALETGNAPYILVKDDTLALRVDDLKKDVADLEKDVFAQDKVINLHVGTLEPTTPTQFESEPTPTPAATETLVESFQACESEPISTPAESATFVESV